MRRCTAVLVAAAALLTGCGGEDVGEKPDLPDETPALWNPCDALDPAFIERQFGSVAEEEHGTDAVPECRFKPAEETGQAVVTSSYTLFTGTLDDAWESMGQPDDAEVTEPDIEGADAARIVVDVVKKQLYVTGFVENGDLIQNVNVVDPTPYDEQQVLAGVRATLALLSEHAVESGVEDSSD
jgi:hypothetical protein